MSLDVDLTITVNVGTDQPATFNVHSANITHNLTRMAMEAGIYGIVWWPEENGITQAGQLVEPLTRAIEEMQADPDRFKAFNSPNGWGLYKHLLPWLEQYRDACAKYPIARVTVCR